MSYTLVVRPEAESDIEEALGWYESQSEGLAADFLQAVEEGLRKIQESPLSYQVVREQIRRARLRRFPYSLMYRVSEGTVFVLGCFHAKRNPEHWLERS